MLRRSLEKALCRCDTGDKAATLTGVREEHHLWKCSLHTVSDEGSLQRQEEGKRSPEKECTYYREKRRGDHREVTKEREISGKDGQVTYRKPHLHCVTPCNWQNLLSCKGCTFGSNGCHGQGGVYLLRFSTWESGPQCAMWGWWGL